MGGPAGSSQPAPRVREGTLQQAVIRRAVAVATRSGAARVLAAQGPRAAIDQRALGRKPKRRPRDVTASRVQPGYSHARAACKQKPASRNRSSITARTDGPFVVPERITAPKNEAEILVFCRRTLRVLGELTSFAALDERDIPWQYLINDSKMASAIKKKCSEVRSYLIVLQFCIR
ncbi:hypothetical protein HPB50_004500 [Hyalomma asiaticum]|uniref:Uncharacterized protein n=1 Tax=Hyalomma asiaticum TaxID=266040 RepID=A0ACB7TIM1_HYAAI|nr:hypothetical protein HPB50_004500 [Hyalomma asiaticum]